MLTETKAPAGYKLVDPVTFTVDETGAIALVGTPEGWSASDNGGIALVTATDEPIEAMLVKVSAASEGESGNEGEEGEEGSAPAASVTLAGAEFTLEPAEGSAFADGSSEPVALAVSGEDGSVELPFAQLVAGGSYVLTETKAPLGYELVAPATFTVGEDGTLVLVEGTDPAWSVGVNELGTVTLTAKDEPIEVSLAKQGELADGTTGPLAGAEFTLEPAEGSAFADGSTDAKALAASSADGAVSIESAALVAGGTYVLTETKAPAGYELIEGSLTFVVASDGTLSVVEGPSDAYAIADDGVRIVATDEPIEARLLKAAPDGTALAGAEFTLAPAEGSAFADGSSEPVALAASGEDGSVELPFAQLVAGGSYTLTETKAPAGYELVEPVTFTVGEDGALALATGTDTAWSVSEGEDGMVTLTAADEPVEVQIVKVDAAPEGEDQQVLAGAEFTLAPAEGSTFADGSTEPVALAASGEDGVVTVEPATLVAGGTYVLTEAKAPAGYELIEGSLTFTVGDDGMLTLAEGTDTAVWSVSQDEAGVVTLTAADEPVRVQLLKSGMGSDGAALPLAGAEFALAPAEGSAFADGSTNAVAVGPTDENGVIDFGAATLASGNTYTLAETKAPLGYELVEPVTFLVNEDGTISLAEGGDSAWSVQADPDGAYEVISATDEPIEARLLKAAPDGTALPGAEFTLAPAEGSAFADGSSEPVALAVSGEDGSVELPFAQLVAGGSYVLTETKAPLGYKLAAPATFMVGEDGSIALAEGTDAAWSVSEGEGGVAQLTAVDEPIEFTLEKLGALADGSTNAVAGAEFTLAPAEGSAFADGTNEALAIQMTETSLVTLSAQLVAGGTYALTETKAPAGYELIADLVTFTVGEDGSLSVSGNMPRGYQLASEGVGLVATDESIETGLTKDSASGAVLAGAKFEIRGAFADSSTAKQFTTDADGRISLDAALVAGETYVVSEIAAPEGYVLLEADATLLVHADGTLELTDKADGFALYEAGDGLVVTNTPITQNKDGVPKTGDTTDPTTALLSLGLGSALLLGGLGLLIRRHPDGGRRKM